MIHVGFKEATNFMRKSITVQGEFIQIQIRFCYICIYFGLLLRLSPSRNVTYRLPVAANRIFFYVHVPG